MKNTIPQVTGIIFFFVILFAFPLQAFCMDEPGFAIGRMVVCEEVVDREPVGSAEVFSSSREKVYCFLEATHIERDMDVVFVWYHEKTEMARVSLPLRQGPRWRTQSSKKFAGLKGIWTVELQESSGIVLNTVSFAVE